MAIAYRHHFDDTAVDMYMYSSISISFVYGIMFFSFSHNIKIPHFSNKGTIDKFPLIYTSRGWTVYAADAISKTVLKAQQFLCSDELTG